MRLFKFVFFSGFFILIVIPCSWMLFIWGLSEYHSMRYRPVTYSVHNHSKVPVFFPRLDGVTGDIAMRPIEPGLTRPGGYVHEIPRKLRTATIIWFREPTPGWFKQLKKPDSFVSRKYIRDLETNVVFCSQHLKIPEPPIDQSTGELSSDLFLEFTSEEHWIARWPSKEEIRECARRYDESVKLIHEQQPDD
jgi:hypothetical protein